MVLANSLAVASAPIALTTLLSIASFVTLVTLVALCACCKCCHRPLKEEDLEAYGVTTNDGHAPVVQFRDGKSKPFKGRPSSEKMPKSALKKSTRAESAPTDPSTTLLHTASTRRALPSLPSELKTPSSPTRNSSASDLYATVEKQGGSVVAVVHDWKSERDTKTTRTTVSRSSTHRLKQGEEQQLVDDHPSYARIPQRNVTYDTIDAESDLTDPLYSKVDTVDNRPSRYEYPPFGTKAQTQTGKRSEHLYQRVDDDASQIYAGGSEDPYSSIPSDVGGAKRLRAIDDDDDDDESSAYEPGYARVTGKPPKESSVDDAPGPSNRAVPIRSVDHLYTKINRHSAPVSDDFSSDRRPPSPPPLPDNRDRRPRSEQPNEEAVREPSYRYITVRESLDVLRARMANQQREHSERIQQQTGPVREHYYATIGSEHGYEVVPNRPPQQPLYEDVLNNGMIDGDAHRYDVVYPSGSSESGTLTSGAHMGGQDSATSTPRRLSIPPPIPPTSPIPERTPPKTEPSSRMYSRSTTGDFTTASEESRGADSFYSIDRDDLPPKRPNDPLVRGMAAFGQGAGELIDRGLALIARSVVADAPPTPNGPNAPFPPEMTAAGGNDFDSSLELSASPLPAVDRTDSAEMGTGQGMPPPPQQRYPSATSHQKPISSLTTASSAPLAPNGHNASHPRSSQVTSSASRSGFADDVDRWPTNEQQQFRAAVASSSGNGDDIYNGRRLAPDTVFPESGPGDGWSKRPLAREDSDQMFVTAPTSANDFNGRNTNGGAFDTNSTSTPTLSSYRQFITKQSSEESSDQETEPAFTARRRDWSDLSGGRGTESLESTKSDRRLREALRTRTDSQESSSGVSGSLDTETKLDDNRTLSRELIDDATPHVDPGRSSRSGRRSAASATSDAMHDSGMFAPSFGHPDSHNSPDHPDTISIHQQEQRTDAQRRSSPARSMGSPDVHGSRIPVLASKMKRQTSPPDDAATSTRGGGRALHVGFPSVYEDENGFYPSKSIPTEAGVRPAADYKPSPSKMAAPLHHQSPVKTPTSLRGLDNSNTPFNGNKSSIVENSGSVPLSSSRLNFRPVFDESPISPDSMLSSQDTPSEILSNDASSTFGVSGASALLDQRSGSELANARAQEAFIAARDRSLLTEHGKDNKDSYGGVTAKRQGTALLATGAGQLPGSSESRSEAYDEQRRSAVDARSQEGVVAAHDRPLPTEYGTDSKNSKDSYGGITAKRQGTTFLPPAAGQPPVSSGMRSEAYDEQRRSAVDARSQEALIAARDRSLPTEYGKDSKESYGGVTAKQQGTALLATGAVQPPTSLELRSEAYDERGRAAVDPRRWPPPTGEPLSVDVIESPTNRRKVETRDYVSPVDLGTKRAWPLQTTDGADDRRDVSPERAAFASGLVESEAGQYYQRLTSTPMEKRAETTDSETCDGTCYCHSSMPVPERVWDENLYEMDKVRWGANRKSSSEESAKSYDARLL